MPVELAMENSTQSIAPARETHREKIRRFLALCDERLQTHPQDVASLVEIGKALWDMGQESKALEYWNKVLALHPGNPLLRQAIQDYGRELSGRSGSCRVG